MSKARVLIVEDEPINLEILAETLNDEGYEALTAFSGESAWHALQENADSLDVVLLDRMMPDMDGIEILRRMKSHPALDHTPVIMQTAMTAEEDVAEGLQAGAFYYLTKPINPETLLAIVAVAVADKQHQAELRKEVDQANRSLKHLQQGRFTFRTPEDARDIATSLANVAPDPGRVVLGLSELMLNAVEHGNLGITYAEKSRLIAADQLFEEVQRRLQDPLYGPREAELILERSEGEIRFLIRDQGQGFNWEKYLEISPERAFDTHGRGIAMSRLISFVRMEYRGCGNEVLAVVADTPEA